METLLSVTSASAVQAQMLYIKLVLWCQAAAQYEHLTVELVPRSDYCIVADA